MSAIGRPFRPTLAEFVALRDAPVVRVSPGGARTPYPITEDTDAARGTALEAAVADAASDDCIYLTSLAVYALSTPILIGAGMTLTLQGVGERDGSPQIKHTSLTTNGVIEVTGGTVWLDNLVIRQAGVKFGPFMASGVKITSGSLRGNRLWIYSNCAAIHLDGTGYCYLRRCRLSDDYRLVYLDTTGTFRAYFCEFDTGGSIHNEFGGTVELNYCVYDVDAVLDSSVSLTDGDPILASLKTVDGTSSGLDADLLRGTTPGATGLALLDDTSAAASRATLGLEQSPNTQTDDYTLVLSDASKLVEMNKGTANTLTVPPNSSVAYPIGTQISIAQIGAGVTTIAPGSGVTLQSANSALRLRSQYSLAILIKTATNTWRVGGDLKV